MHLCLNDACWRGAILTARPCLGPSTAVFLHQLLDNQLAMNQKEHQRDSSACDISFIQPMRIIYILSESQLSFDEIGRSQVCNSAEFMTDRALYCVERSEHQVVS